MRGAASLFAEDGFFRRAAAFLFSKKGAALLLAALLLLNLALLFVLAKYDRPASDDYAYSYLTKPAWRETGSVSAVLSAAVKMSAWVYQIWQGSYSACFLMALQPGVFGELRYAITPVLLLLSFILCVGVFFCVCLKKLLGMDNWSVAVIALSYALISINFLPSAAQAFFWYNGSIYYAFFYSLSLLLVSLIVSSLGQARGQVLRCVLSALLALFLGGGNLATCLNLAVVLTLASALSLFFKRRDPVLLVSAVFFLIGFALNVLAPGNALRMESEGTGRGLIESVLLSILYNLELYGKWFTGPVVLSGLLLVPVFLPYAKKLSESFSFRYPLLVLLGLMLMNAAGYAPLLYSGSNLRIPRLYDIQFFESVLLYYIALFYITGWAVSARSPAPQKASARTQAMRLAVSLLLFALFVSLLPAPPFDERTQEEPTMLSAYHSLVSRDTYRYARARDARQAQLEDPALTDVTVPPIPTHPELFHFRDLRADASKNALTAAYFGKNSVVPSADAGNAAN